MRNHIRRTITLTVAAMALVSAGAFAQGKGHDKGKEKGKRESDEDRVRVAPGAVLVPGKSERRGKHEGKGEREGEANRVRVDSRGNVAVPPGLAKKPGHMPPGQYKKLYPRQGVTVLREVLVQHGYTVVRTAPYGQSQYVYYRLPNGTVERAIVSPGVERLTFTNVPASLLQAVLARLY